MTQAANPDNFMECGWQAQRDTALDGPSPAGSQSKAPSPLRSAGALHNEFHRCKEPAAKDNLSVVRPLTNQTYMAHLHTDKSFATSSRGLLAARVNIMASSRRLCLYESDSLESRILIWIVDKSALFSARD